MLYPSWLAIAAMAILPAAHAASDAPQATDPSQPSAPAAAFQYESAFKGYQAIPQDDTRPEQVWREANEEVARIGGHAGYMRAHDASSHAVHPSPPVRQPDTNPSGQAAKPAASGNRGHSGHHGMHH